MVKSSQQRRSSLISLVSLIGIYLTIRALAWTVSIEPFQFSDGLLICAFLVSIGLLAFDVILPASLVERAHNDEPLVAQEFIDLGPRGGYVYLLRGPKGYYKIGHTKDPNDRHQTFKLNLPFDVEYLHLITCDDRRSAEALLHRCFAHRRVKGTEWFLLTDDDIKLIKAIIHI